MMKLSNEPTYGKRPAPRLAVLFPYRPAGHEFLRRAQAQAECFYTRRSDGWLYAGRTRIRRAVKGKGPTRSIVTGKGSGTLQDRQPRSTRAVAVANIVALDLGRMDVRTLRVIDYRRGDVGISIARKAQFAGISYDAAKGAIHDLAACGYQGAHQTRKKDKDGRYPIATRWFTAKFFRTMGLWRALCAVRKLLGLSPPKEPKVIGTVAVQIDKLVTSLSAPSPWPRK